jgi:malic enzyme
LIGTAAVALGGIFTSLRVTKVPIEEKKDFCLLAPDKECFDILIE